MARPIIRRSGAKHGEVDPDLATRQPMAFRELVVRSRRVDVDRVELWVAASPAGTMKERAIVSARAPELHTLALALGLQSRLEDAASVGRALSEVLLVEPVYRLLRESLRRLEPREGLRVRLALDATLIDLPWEFAFRPEARSRTDLGGFLFLDPKLSLVRGVARARARLQPSNKAQRLVFLGTYWSGGDDRWGVEQEFQKLESATRTIGNFLSTHFVDVVDSNEVERELALGASILHYAGHCDRDVRGSYLVREADDRGGRMFWYASDVGRACADAETRLAVFSACNSGTWGFIEPVLKRGVPAVIGVHGSIETRSSIEFCDKLYAALAVGLSLDEASTYARLHVVRAGTLPCDWGRPMVYLATKDAVLFPRPGSSAVREQQESVREARGEAVAVVRASLEPLREEGAIGRFISDLAEHQVLILGNFGPERKAVLDGLRARLEELELGYLPCVFDFEVPKGRRLGETVLSLAGLSRFVIADLTDPVSVPAELEKVVKEYPSVPVQPILLEGKRPYALFEDHIGKPNVLEVVHYRDLDDLNAKLEAKILAPLEARAKKLRKRRARA